MTLLRATKTFMAPGRLKIAAGDVVDSTDPIVKGREGLFEPVASTVETASAAPGEKRAAKKAPAKKAVAPKADPSGD